MLCLPEEWSGPTKSGFPGKLQLYTYIISPTADAPRFTRCSSTSLWSVKHKLGDRSRNEKKPYNWYEETVNQILLCTGLVTEPWLFAVCKLSVIQNQESISGTNVQEHSITSRQKNELKCSFIQHVISEYLIAVNKNSINLSQMKIIKVSESIKC